MLFLRWGRATPAPSCCLRGPFRSYRYKGYRSPRRRFARARGDPFSELRTTRPERPFMLTDRTPTALSRLAWRRGDRACLPPRYFEVVVTVSLPGREPKSVHGASDYP